MAENLRGLLQTLNIGSASLPESWPEKSGRVSILRRTYEAGTTIADWDQRKQALVLVVSGWVACAKVLTDGARMVVDFGVSGDIVPIGSTEWARESVTAVSDVSTFELLGPIPDSVLELPRPIAKAIMRAQTGRQARLMEHMASVGRRDAGERIAHLLLELSWRVGARKEAGATRYSCPLTQSDLADALGLTAVHVNRVLKELRERGLASFRGGVVEIYDWSRLAQFAGFDTSYLTLKSE